MQHAKVNLSVMYYLKVWVERERFQKTETFIIGSFNLVPLVFVPSCAGLPKRATLESSVTESILIGFENNTNGQEFVRRAFES